LKLRLATLLVSACAGLMPAQAVIVLDSTWEEEGGTPENPAAGFAAHIALANEPQFDAAVSFSRDGKNWGNCSGVWIGNDEAHGYVLTAAHCFKPDDEADDFGYRTQGGTVLEGVAFIIEPAWNGNFEARLGYDLALIQLSAPVTDAGPPPLLYSGRREAGRILTFTGFGNRGIGSSGDDDDTFGDVASTYEEKAAGQGLIEEVAEAVLPMPAADDDAGNRLSITMPKEDGSVANPFGGPTTPATRLVGLLGVGDSGSPAWMQLADGRWVIVGVSSWGDGEAGYGDVSSFVRLSFHAESIREVVPGAVFASD
jgi:hypothetical protein